MDDTTTEKAYASAGTKQMTHCVQQQLSYKETECSTCYDTATEDHRRE